MWCEVCNKQFPGECTCTDRDERMARITQSDKVGYQRCTKCGKHYALCKCEQPAWEIYIGKA